jgi:hypothetical protein
MANMRKYKGGISFKVIDLKAILEVSQSTERELLYMKV